MILTIIHVIIALLLSLVILLQGKGGWLTQRWKGEGFHAKRGVERIFFSITVVLAILFLISSIVTLIKF